MADTPLPRRLETRRLTLRALQAGDGPWYLAAGQRNQAHLARYESRNVIRQLTDPEQAEAAVRQLAAGWDARTSFYLVAFEKASGDFAAQIYLGPVAWDLPEFELGYFADSAHEGQGYVTEAARAVLGWTFERLGAHRVRLECDDTNTRSQRVAERLGFMREGHLRENKRHPDGSLSGTLYYGLLRREHEANSKK
jgi:aminoglycoside 6'-N-acetyltransferase